jgi:SAM-dependent methyltransferase
MVKTVLRTVNVLRDEHMVSWPRNIKRHDVTKSLPYATDSVSAIYSSHMLEHLYHDQALALLRECRRVLRPGCTLRLALPDAEQFARNLVHASMADSTEAGLTFTTDLAMAPLTAPNRRQRLISRFASSPHRWQPTTGLVLSMLREAGFAKPEPRDYLVGELPGLHEVEHRSEGLFVEAKA